MQQEHDDTQCDFSWLPQSGCAHCRGIKIGWFESESKTVAYE